VWDKCVGGGDFLAFFEGGLERGVVMVQTFANGGEAGGVSPGAVEIVEEVASGLEEIFVFGDGTFEERFAFQLMAFEKDAAESEIRESVGGIQLEDLPEERLGGVVPVKFDGNTGFVPECLGVGSDMRRNGSFESAEPMVE